MRSPTSPRTPTHARHRSTTMPSPGHTYSSSTLSDSSPIQNTPHRPPHSRKSSLHNSTSYPLTPQSPSQQTPTSTRRMSIRSINGGGSVASDVSHSTELIPSGGVVQSNGLGSLADELADAWDEDEEEQEDGDMSMNISRMDDDDEGGRGADGMDERDEEVWMNGTQSSPPAVEVKSRKRRAQQRRGSSFDDEEMEQKDAYRISPALDARLVEIERLARRGMDFVRESDDSKEGEKKHGGGVMNRMIHALRELGGQAGLEGATTRLITTQFTLSASLTEQTRTLHSLAYPLFFSPLSTIIPSSNTNISSPLRYHESSNDDPSDIFEQLLTDLDELFSILPSFHQHHHHTTTINPPHPIHPSRHTSQHHHHRSDLEPILLPELITSPSFIYPPSPSSSSSSKPTSSTTGMTTNPMGGQIMGDNIISLTPLTESTVDLLSTLESLQDTIYISHQTSQSATRALRSTRAFVAELLAELNDVEDSIMFIEKGRWNDRLRKRDCAEVCREVVDGFENYSGKVREMLMLAAGDGGDGDDC